MRAKWFVSAITDDRGEFDIPQMMVPIAVLGILAISGYDVAHNANRLDAQQLGTGIAAVIAALGAYKWGEGKSRDAVPPKPANAETKTTADRD